MSDGNESPMLIDSNDDSEDDVAEVVEIIPDDESEDSDDSGDSEEEEENWTPDGSPHPQDKSVPPPPPPPSSSQSKANQSQKSSNSNIHNSAEEWVELQDSTAVQDDKAALLEEFERKRRARQLHVPTDDTEVGALLRLHGAPFCLFGEGPAERRDRLKDLLSHLTHDQQQQRPVPTKAAADDAPSPRQAEETWYHAGPPRLRAVREFILHFSLPRARDRLKLEREVMADHALKTAVRQEVASRLRGFQLLTSQNADTRPVSCIRFSPDGKKLASSSWSGSVQVWDVADEGQGEERSFKLIGHEGYVDSLAWHPEATLSQEASQLNLASCGRDGSVLLWGLKEKTPLAHLPNMGARVTDVAFHPSGRLLALTVEDASWRLWEVEEGEEVLFQEGHGKGISCISLQKDGSLAATGGMDGFGRVWDLRTGRCVMFMAGHQSALLAIDWSPDGYHLASGSQDNSVRIWDVRQRATVLTIPAHTSLVSGVKYDPLNGSFLATCSYDGSVRLWPRNTCQMLRSLEGHGHKIMSVDIAPDGGTIATSAFDKTYKIWGPD